MKDFQNNAPTDLSTEFVDKAKDIPLAAINLPARARAAVEAEGAGNSLEATRIVINGFVGISGIGQKTIAESRSLVSNFIRIVETSSVSELQKLIDPRKVHFESANGNLIDAFPGILELYLIKKSGKNFNRNQDILNKRFALNGGKQYTLEDIGTFYDLTRERIRQVEEKTIENISKLLSGNLKTKDWKLDQLLLSNYNVLKERLNFAGAIILKHEVDYILFDIFGGALKDGYQNLLMEVAGYIKLPNSFDGFRGTTKPCWCLTSKYQKTEIESIFKSLDGIFDSSATVPLFEITIRAKKCAKRKISNESLNVALKACNEIEIAGDSVSVKFSSLRNAADKAFRVLESANKTMHYSDIAKEINLLDEDSINYKTVKETNLKNQLVSDGRFTPIGRSGEWGLSSWHHLNNVTIIEAIESVLHKTGQPLSFQKISDESKKIRPNAAEGSIKIYLSDRTDKFTRVGKDLYALTSWKMAPYKGAVKHNVVSNETFYKAAKEILRKTNPISLSEFISAASDKTELSEISVRQRVVKSNYLKTKLSENKHKLVFCSDDFFGIDESGLNRKLLRDKVQDEIRAILYETPNIPMKKGDLYLAVNKVFPCQRPTFYHYLEETKDIRQFKEGSNYFAVFEYHEKKKRIEVDLTPYNIDAAMKKKLERPFSMLNLEDIDIALFELGLLFENELKEYLLKAKHASQLHVTQNDLSKLSKMIDCVIREQIVTKGHHLNTLREERNDRAHGTHPTNDERKILFDKAHYVANLFVKYIAFFNVKKLELP